MLPHNPFFRSLCLAVMLLLGGCATAPAPKVTVGIMERVADRQLATPARRASTHWAEATSHAGMMALAEISQSPRFEAAMMKMGEDNEWKLGARPYHADDHAVGQTYIALFKKHRDPRMIKPMREIFDSILANPRDTNLDFNVKKNPDRLDRWSWCDALFMSPPAWVQLWSVTGKREYLDFAVAHWWITSDFLYDKAERLYFRDSLYFEPREANGQKIFWSRGNGWVMGGLVRMLQSLPADHPSRPRFVKQFTEMASRIITLQQADGLWRASLLDPASYPLEETSGSAFYTYALAWGVNEKLLKRATYKPAVLKAWAALNAHVTPEGNLTHVQPIGADPKQFEAGATESYGVGAFLLAGSEVYRLTGGAKRVAKMGGAK